MTPTHDVNPSMVKLHLRLRAEYLEMPGLRLTLAQAARLFNLPPDVCTATLEALVEVGFLHKHGTSYSRNNSGPPASGPRGSGFWTQNRHAIPSLRIDPKV